MLNSTLCATSRAICCLLENYQTDEGVGLKNASGFSTCPPFILANPLITSTPFYTFHVGGILGGHEERESRTFVGCFSGEKNVAGICL